MKTVTDDKYAAKLLKQIQDDILKETDRDTTKWHVSDLVFPLAAYFKHRFGYKDDAEDVGYYFTGVCYHEKLQRILGIANAEVRKELLNVIATVDYLGEDMLEIKTSRKWTVPDVPPGHYVQQAAYYAAFHNRHEVLVVVIYPTAGRTWKGEKSSTVDIKVWRLQFSDEDLKLIIKDIKLTTAALEKALKLKDPSGLPPCPDWKIEKMLKKAGKENLFKAWKGGYDEKAKIAHPMNYVELSNE